MHAMNIFLKTVYFTFEMSKVPENFNLCNFEVINFSYTVLQRNIYINPLFGQKKNNILHVYLV